ncbi:hypothetical protein ABG775_06185 [Peribacillus simplex]|uniref:hypothetical protein n=1 Tax=Peribacillus simplex TaxID=1478 RepID=UPI003391AD48
MKKMTDIVSVVKELIGPAATEVIDYGLSMAPYIGELNQNYKISRAEKRIRESKNQLIEINNLLQSDLKAKEFMEKRIAPIFISDLIEDHEDSKINYLLNGFQNVFIEQKFEESIVLHYFDILRGLRYADIRTLYYIAGLDDIYPSTFYFEGSEYDSISKSIYNKLSNLYLVDIMGRHGAILGKIEPTPENISINKSLGKEFLLFIAQNEQEKEIIRSL